MSQIGALSQSSVESHDDHQSTAPPSALHHSTRESFLLWCIGAIFGAVMLALLVAMVVAEVSIHRGANSLTTPAGAASSIGFTAGR